MKAMKKYNINSKGEADHLNVSYYVVDDVEAKLAALRSRIAELEKTGNELVQEFRSPYIGGIYSASFEHKNWRLAHIFWRS
jgi:hypothetical protein